MTDAVIVSTARTPIGKAYRGALNATEGATLLGHAIGQAVARAKVDPKEVEDVVMGAALQQGTTGGNIARKALLRALADFLKANNLRADWADIEKAPNEALVNALSMMSPYGPAEKQALLEAPDLKTRAEVLVAITEIELAKKNSEGEAKLQ